MGQIFYACAYDIETKTCCVMDADKFHANCYAYSGAVFSIHYLLRQKPYHVMWGGDYVVLNDRIADFSRTEDLLGISTYENYEDFEMNNDDLPNKDYYDKVQFIGTNNKLWNHINVWDEAINDKENTHSVTYSGYLVNHTKKLAVDLEAYHLQSKFLTQDGVMTSIDAVPVLTETGEGAQMAFFNGISADSTEKLAGEWCGDLLQIINELPEDYKIINCCFAEVLSRMKYCYRTFGVNENGYLLNDSDGKLFEAVKLNFFGARGPISYIKVEVTTDKISYVPVRELNKNEDQVQN